MSGTATRVLTAAVLIPIVVAVIWWGPTWLIALIVGGITILALIEFFAIGSLAGLHGFRNWTIVCSLALVFVQWDSTRIGSDVIGWMGYPRYLLGWPIPVQSVFVVFLLGIGVATVVSKRDVKGAMGSAAVTCAGMLLVALPMSFAVILQSWGRHGGALLFTLSLVWVGDSVAFFVGRKYGRRMLSPSISPNKTWEGAIGNLIGTAVVAGAVGTSLVQWTKDRFEPGWTPILHFLMVGALVSVFGQVGDLLESAYKRSAGVKDSGALLPGHGGVLDRIDALIFAVPVVWAYLTLLK
jgi:phosphatidate cytidylyltransferase